MKKLLFTLLCIFHISGLLSQDYCTPEHEGCCNEYITAVCISDLYNSSEEPTATTIDGYSDFSTQVIEVSRGDQYTGTVVPNFGWAESNMNIWIDYNSNDKFDSDELVYSKQGMSPYTFSITIPDDAIIGDTRMRVRYQFGRDYTPSPCAVTSTNGETEDYTVRISDTHDEPSNFSLTIIDKWGRILDTLRLVDWEGYIFNPSIELIISGSPCSEVTFMVPNAPRIYMDRPSTVGNEGPIKTLIFDDNGRAITSFSIAPDRDGDDEYYELVVTFGSEQRVIPIKVIDQDRPDRPLDFPYKIDFTRDLTHFMDDMNVREVITQALEDWLYYFDDMDLDIVRAGEEESRIVDNNWVTREYVSNNTDYEGFLLYAYGTNNDEMRSGGAPIGSKKHTINGQEIDLWRSGGCIMETRGNYDLNGWTTNITDEGWFNSYQEGFPNDLYRIAFHEIGHAIGFNSKYDIFNEWIENNVVDDGLLNEYQDISFGVNSSHHFVNLIGEEDGIQDRVSNCHMFGSFNGGNLKMPHGRGINTKANILALQAIGYKLRASSPFSTIATLNSVLLDGIQNEDFLDYVKVSGGIPIYHFEMVSGNFPKGLNLCPFTGQISGVPIESGSFSFSMMVSEYDEEFIIQDYELIIQRGTITATDDIINKIAFSVFPNPVTDMLTVNLKEKDIDVIKVFDSMGKLRIDLQNQKHIDISFLPSGVYIIVINGSLYTNIFKS